MKSEIMRTKNGGCLWLTVLCVAIGLSGCSALFHRGDEEISAASRDDAEPKVTAEDTRERTPLQLWQDPGFQRRFTDTYIAATDIEPTVGPEEREKLLEVARLMESDELKEEERLQEAEEFLVDYLDGRHGKTASPKFHFLLGNIYFQQEKLVEAADTFRTAVKEKPNYRNALRNLGLVYIRQGKWQPAVEAFTKVVELGGGDAIIYGLLGFAYSSSEDSMAAESAYRMAILLEPDRLEWKLGLAKSLATQQRFADVVALCNRLIKENPNHAELWLTQASAYIGLDKPIKAAENYELVDQMGASTVASLSTLGDIYINEGLHEPAVSAYTRAMKMDPNHDYRRAMQAAKVLTAQNAYDEARDLIAHIEDVRDEPLPEEDRKELLKLQARMAVAEGASEEEVRILEEVVALDPLDGEALILLGQHASREGRLDKAVFYYERAENIEGYEADAKVRHAQVLVKQGKYKEALPLLRQAQSIKHRDNVQEYLEQVQRVAKAG